MPQYLTPLSISRALPKDVGGEAMRAVVEAMGWHARNDPRSGFFVQNYAEVSSTGDVGVTLNYLDPYSSPLGHSIEYDQINYRFAESGSGDGEIFVALDPNSEITDPLNPVGTGSNLVSEEPIAAVQDNNFLTDHILIMDWGDALGFVLMDPQNRYVHTLCIAGHIFEPHFGNDAARNLTGHGWFGGSPDIGTNLVGNLGGSNCSEALTPDGWSPMRTKKYGENSNRPQWGPVDLPITVTVEAQNAGGNWRSIGDLKYLTTWDYSDIGTPSGSSTDIVGNAAVGTLVSKDHQGFLFVNKSESGHGAVVPWNTDVDPGWNDEEKDRYKGLGHGKFARGWNAFDGEFGQAWDAHLAVRYDTYDTTGDGAPIKPEDIGEPSDGQSVRYARNVGEPPMYWEGQNAMSWDGTKGTLAIVGTNGDSLDLVGDQKNYSGFLHSSGSLAIRGNFEEGPILATGPHPAVSSSSPRLWIGWVDDGAQLGGYIRAYLHNGVDVQYDLNTPTHDPSLVDGLYEIMIEHDTGNGIAVLRTNLGKDGQYQYEVSDTDVTFQATPINPDHQVRIGASGVPGSGDELFNFGIELQGVLFTRGHDDHAIQCARWIEGYPMLSRYPADETTEQTISGDTEGDLSTSMNLTTA